MSVVNCADRGATDFLKHAPVETPTTKKNISNALRLWKVRL